MIYGKNRRAGRKPVRLSRGIKRKLAGLVVVLLLGFLGILSCHQTEELEGLVTHVSDGDTLIIQTGEKGRYKEVKIRIYGIDAPESGQAFGRKSKNWLASRVYGRPVRIREKELDQYGRVVGEVYYGEENVGLASVREGMAWYYARYASRDADLGEAQEQARKERKGLWTDKEPVPPWVFRNSGR